VAAFDLSDPGAPTLLGRALLDLGFPEARGWWWNGRLGSGETMALVGDTMVLKSHGQINGQGEDYRAGEWIYLVDVSNPARIRLGARLDLPDFREPGPFQVIGERLFSHHTEPIEGDERATRFYLDEWDISDPQSPERLRSTNVPGAPIHVDPENGRLLSVDFQWERVDLEPNQDCWEVQHLHGHAHEDAKGTCWALMRSLELVELPPDGDARRVDRMPIRGAYLRDVQVADGAVFVGLHPSAWGWWDEGEGHDPRPTLVTLSGLLADELTKQGEVRLETPYSWLYAAHGSSAVVLQDTPPSCFLYDGSEPSEPKLELQQLMTGYGYDVHIVGDRLLTANGKWGVQAIELAQ